MRRFLPFVAPLLATSTLYACESDSGSSSSGTVTPFEAGGVDAPTTPPPMLDGATADTAIPDVVMGPAPVTVVVNGLDGKPKADVDVVFHDATGAVVGQAKTTASGQASSPAGLAVSMASALLGTATSRNRHVVTWTGVKGADTLLTTDIDAGNEIDVVGSYDITYAAAPGNPTGYEAHMASCSAFKQAAGTMGMTALRSCVRPGNNNHVLVRALSGSLDIGYAFFKGAPPANGPTPIAVTVNAFATPGTLTVNATNLPANFSAGIDFAEVAGTQLTFGRLQGFVSSQSTSYPFAGVATNYAESFQLVSTGRVGSSEHRIIQRVAVGSSATIDYGQPLANILTRTLDNTDYKRPKITWTAAAPGLGGSDGGAVTIRWLGGNESAHGWTILVPPSATDAKFPALPASAAAWLPPDPGDAGQQLLYDPEVVFVESDIIPSADDFRQQAGIVLPFGTNEVFGNVVMPKVGKLRAVQYSVPPG